MNANEHNARAWDRLATKGHRFSRPATAAEFASPLQTIDPTGWYDGSVQGLDVLCLAAGGGRQGPLYAAAGAKVTVVDISAEQLAIDRQVANDRKLQVTTVQTSMDELSMFGIGRFDVVIHPVSTCYVACVAPVFAAVARVTRPGGLYVSQHKSPQNLQASLEPDREGRYQLARAYNCDQSLDKPFQSDEQTNRLREAGTLEYQHTFEALLGGICQAGFLIECFVEPDHADAQAAVGTFGHRCRFVAPYLRVKARRQGQPNLLPLDS